MKDASIRQIMGKAGSQMESKREREGRGEDK